MGGTTRQKRYAIVYMTCCQKVCKQRVKILSKYKIWSCVHDPFRECVTACFATTAHFVTKVTKYAVMPASFVTNEVASNCAGILPFFSLGYQHAILCVWWLCVCVCVCVMCVCVCVCARIKVREREKERETNVLGIYYATKCTRQCTCSDKTCWSNKTCRQCIKFAIVTKHATTVFKNSRYVVICMRRWFKHWNSAPENGHESKWFLLVIKQMYNTQTSLTSRSSSKEHPFT